MSEAQIDEKANEAVDRARLQAYHWQDVMEKCHQRLPTRVGRTEAERRLHAAAFALWNQVKRFRHEDHIEREWHEEVVPGLGEPLEGLRQYRLRTETVKTQTYDPDTRSSETVVEERPWTMSPHVADAVIDQLERCTNKLGFDRTPAELRKKFSHREVDPDEIEVDEFGPQPVEVPVDGDD